MKREDINIRFSLRQMHPGQSQYPLQKLSLAWTGTYFSPMGPAFTSCLWASWSDRVYAVGAAVSESGSIMGPWKHLEERFFPENGGHGMLFEDKSGRLLYTLHYPNDKYKERPVFREVVIKEGRLCLDK